MILKGENFQAWKSFSIEIDGLTVVTGPSDLGKSSLYRALKGIVRNNLPAEFVNVEAKNLALKLDIDGILIEVSRGKKSSSEYKVDGEDFSKLSRDVPPKVKDLHLGEIELGGFSIDPIFSGQHDNKFLLQNVSPSELNTILGAFSSTEKLDYGKREANLRISRCNSEAKILSTEVQEAETRKFNAQEYVEKLAPYVEAIATIENRVRTIKDTREVLTTALRFKQEISSHQEILGYLVIPNAEKLEKLTTLIQTLKPIPKQRIVVADNKKLVHMSDEVAGGWANVLTSIKVSNTYIEILNKLADLKTVRANLQRYDNLSLTIKPEVLVGKVATLGSLKAIHKALQSSALLVKEKADIDSEIDELNKECGIICPQCGFNIPLES